VRTRALGVAVKEAWKPVTAGPPDAERTVLLLPGHPS
jgi:hypothetical protein